MKTQKSEYLFERAKERIPGGVNSPVRAFKSVGRNPLFISHADRAFNKDSLRVLINRLGDRAEIKKAYPHKFRHTFSITYLRSGGDVFTLQSLLGHGSLDMVRHYAQIAEVDVEQAHRKASPADNMRL